MPSCLQSHTSDGLSHCEFTITSSVLRVKRKRGKQSRDSSETLHDIFFHFFHNDSSPLISQLQKNNENDCRGAVQLYSAQALSNLTCTVFVAFSGVVCLTHLSSLPLNSICRATFVQVAPLLRSALDLISAYSAAVTPV